MKTGALNIDGKRYYFDTSTGAMLTNAWKAIGTNTKYWFYFQADGSAAANKTLNIGGIDYTFDSVGRSDKAPPTA